MSAARRVIGLFGGTFDPVHNGHLRMALELRQQLGLDEMRLLPAHRPPHRDTPRCSSADRAAMVRLAVADCPQLGVDERELQAERPSYTVDTLAQLRIELGPEVSLCWCVGMDSLVNLHSWSRWQSLTDYAHLLVVARPGWELPADGVVAGWLAQHRGVADDLQQQACGRVVLVTQTLLDISATDIRAQIMAGLSPQFLLPGAVWRYINDKGLYRETHQSNEDTNR